MALEARLKALMGEDTEIQEETVNRMVGDFAQNPADRRKYVSLMGFLDQIGGFDTMHEVTRLYYDNATSASEEYLAIRGLADMLAASPSERNEQQAMDMYRYLLTSDRFTGPEFEADAADAQHNYATLLYKHDFDDEAGRLWFQAYKRNPLDASIRRAYGMYLLRAGSFSTLRSLLPVSPRSNHTVS